MCKVLSDTDSMRIQIGCGKQSGVSPKGVPDLTLATCDHVILHDDGELRWLSQLSLP